MATKVTMPQMGFDMTEGKVARWLKKIGDPVKQGEAVVEIETDKVNIESEAQGDGVLREILVNEGSTVPVKTMIAIIGTPDEDLTAIKAEAGLVAAPAAATQAVAQPIVSAAAPTAGDGRIKASPLAKRIAQEKGLNLATLNGTGPGGRIIKRDIDAALTAMPVVSAPTIGALVAAPIEPVKPIAAAPAPAILGPSVLKAEEVTPTKLRQTIAKRMVAAKQTVPHFYVTTEIDMAEAMALRAKLNALVDDAGKISVNDMVVKATAVALTHFPAINASFGESAIVRHGTVNMGIAVALEQGLITVVVARSRVKRVTSSAVLSPVRLAPKKCKAARLRLAIWACSTWMSSSPSSIRPKRPFWPSARCAMCPW